MKIENLEAAVQYAAKIKAAYNLIDALPHCGNNGVISFADHSVDELCAILREEITVALDGIISNLEEQVESLQ